MRDYKKELEARIAFIKNIIEQSGADGIVFGNSGGKDSALVGILCKLACSNTVGVILPCSSKCNYEKDMEDALNVAKQFEIETRTVDLTELRDLVVSLLSEKNELKKSALANIAPRLRMTVLYAIGANENRLVAGTGNKCERFMGYFTKWGDGAYDFNPIGDLTVSEIYDFLKFLGVKGSIIEKAPSGGLYDGQTDEKEMGVSYEAIEKYISEEPVSETEKEIISRYHKNSDHKRQLPPIYEG